MSCVNIIWGKNEDKKLQYVEQINYFEAHS